MSNHTKRGTARKFAAAMAVALVASVLALATPAGAKQSVSTTRVSGTDRYLTSTALSSAATVAGANSSHFVLVNGTSYADALSAAALAGAKQGTIILLPADGTISASATARMAAATNVTKPETVREVFHFESTRSRSMKKKTVEATRAIEINQKEMPTKSSD